MFRPRSGSKAPRQRGAPSRAAESTAPRHGIARAISKAGLCSRSEAAARVAAGRVSVNGRVVLDPEFPTREGDAILVDGTPLQRATRIVLALNKPRGLVTSARDEHDRDTVYRCLEGSGFGWLAPVGRLDKASEGLLLFTNDPAFAASITDPATGPEKTYHVQIAARADDELLARLESGVELEDGRRLAVKSARPLREGDRNAWLEIVLEEGRNRHIRRLLEAFGVEVLRLVRVKIGEVALGELPKGAWKKLTDGEVAALLR